MYFSNYCFPQYSYRELLDVWGLWEQRAHFDVTMGQTISPPRYSRSVFLLCSFCGKSVSTTLQEQTHRQSASNTSSSSVNKLSSCPNCHKPLPRYLIIFSRFLLCAKAKQIGILLQMFIMSIAYGHNNWCLSHSESK